MDPRKIKWDGKEFTLITAETSSTGEQREVTYKARFAPHPDLLDAFQALLDIVWSLIGMTSLVRGGAPDWQDTMHERWRESTRVQSVSLDYQDDGRRGVVITALHVVEGATSPLVLNTPRVVEADDSGNGGWPAGLHGAVAVLHHEALEYQAGRKRAQADLFA